MQIGEPLRFPAGDPSAGVGPESLPGAEQPQQEYNYYAWGRLARKLIERHLDAVREATPIDTPFVYVDGGASVPWLRDVMRGQFSKNVALKAVKAAVSSFEDRFKIRDETVFPGFRRIRQERMNSVREPLFKRGLAPRSMLEGVAFRVFFEPPDDLDTNNPQALSDEFMRRFNDTPGRVFHEVLENSTDGEIKGSWISLYFEEVPFSISDIVHSTELTEDEANSLLKATADHFAHQFAGKIQRTKILSLDLESVEKLKAGAIKNFPTIALNTIFFKGILDPSRHIVGDIRELSMFEDGTVSVYSMFEVFPFYNKSFSYEDAIRVISEAKRVLRTGGVLIIFPWITRNPQDSEDGYLEGLEEFMKAQGFDVLIEDKDKAGLTDGMGPREQKMVTRSPVFTETGNSLPFLVATKTA